jgi:cob(I)alamin adenosyltransferase
MERKLYLKLMGLKRELNIIADNIMNLSSGNASRDIPLYRSMINDTLNNTIKNILDITNDENIKNVLEKINNNITNINDTLIREQTTMNSITHIANYIRRNADEIKTLLNNIK